MSSNKRNAERRAENNAAYEREYEERESRERAARKRFAPLEARLEELSIDPYELKAYLETLELF
jgi:hypothetical protein